MSYRYKKERSAAFKIRRNPFFGRGSAPNPAGGARDAPIPLVRWEGDTPSHIALHSAPNHLWRSPCIPPRIPARSTPTVMIIGTYIMYRVQIGVGVTGNYWGHLDCQVLRAPQYLNPAMRVPKTSMQNATCKRKHIEKQLPEYKTSISYKTSYTMNHTVNCGLWILECYCAHLRTFSQCQSQCTVKQRLPFYSPLDGLQS